MSYTKTPRLRVKQGLRNPEEMSYFKLFHNAVTIKSNSFDAAAEPISLKPLGIQFSLAAIS